MSETKITIAVLGASGYTGAEMLRIAATHLNHQNLFRGARAVKDLAYATSRSILCG